MAFQESIFLKNYITLWTIKSQDFIVLVSVQDMDAIFSHSMSDVLVASPTIIFSVNFFFDGSNGFFLDAVSWLRIFMDHNFGRFFFDPEKFIAFICH
jgi:hypothetical protein